MTQEISIKEKASQIRLLVLDVDGTLTDGGVYIDSNGVQSRKFNIKDGMGIKLLQDAGVEVALLSHSNMLSILSERAAMLSIKYLYAGKDPKLKVLQIWLQQLALNESQVGFIGDDVNDLEIINKVGLTACPADGHRKVIEAVDIVLQKKGGEGCVREFIDRYLLPGQFNET